MAKQFKVGDKVRRNGWMEQLPFDGSYVHTVTEVFDGGWFNHDGGEAHGDYSPIGGCGPAYWELVEAAPVQHVSSRSNDPATSKAAGEVKRARLRQRVLTVLITTILSDSSTVGRTRHELACEVDAPLNSVTPRLAELRREGKIKDSGQRRDGQIVWVAI